MPNHVHGIIQIAGANYYSPETVNNHSPENTNQRAKNISPLRSPSKTIGSMVRGYKIDVTKWFRENMGQKFPIGKPIFQRNYYDHIIRNEKSFYMISAYILDNPIKWEQDKFYM